MWPWWSISRTERDRSLPSWICFFFKDQCRLLEGIINLLKVLCANKTSERFIIASLPHWYCNLGMIVINSWQCVLIDYYYYFSISFFSAAACSFKKTNRFLLFSPSAITENFSLLSKSDPVVYNVKCWVVAARSGLKIMAIILTSQKDRGNARNTHSTFLKEDMHQNWF